MLGGVGGKKLHFFGQTAGKFPTAELRVSVFITKLPFLEWEILASNFALLAQNFEKRIKYYDRPEFS